MPTARGRGSAHWLVSAIVAAFLIALYSFVLAAVRPQVVLAATPVEVSFTTPESRPYNGTTAAQILDCAVVTETSDALMCTPAEGAVADFADKNVGQGKTVTASPSDFVLSGDNAETYEIQTVQSTTADITARDLTVSITADDKTYDGTRHASVTRSDDRVTGDDLTITADPALFDTKHVGTGKTVTLANIAISGGARAGNYMLTATTATDQADIGQREITVTAVAASKTADGTTVSAVLPSIGAPGIATGDTATFKQVYASSAAGTGITMIPSLVSISDGNDGANYAFTFDSEDVGHIRPGPAASVTFTAQPIDTKFATPIYNVCAPSGGTPPCTPAGATGSTPVAVLVEDAFGNAAGPGAPGADAANTVITVTIRQNNGSGTILGSAPTSGGTATFGNQLVINATTPSTKLHASTTAGSAPTELSDGFAIVSDLEACVGAACDNQAINTLAQKQKSFGKVATGGTFGGGNPVTLQTQFLAFDNGRCSNPTSKSVGQTTEVKVTGTGVSATSPDFSIVLVYPKDTIKAAGYTARNADAFNICLGATWLGGSPVEPWRAKTSLTNSTLTDALPDGNGVYWGWVPNCSQLTATERQENPCISLRTKQAATLRAAVVPGVMSASDFTALGMRDSDLAIVLSKPFPWDGKLGLK